MQRQAKETNPTTLLLVAIYQSSPPEIQALLAQLHSETNDYDFINATDENGNTPFHHLCSLFSNSDDPTVIANAYTLIETFLDYGADNSTKNNHGFIPSQLITNTHGKDIHGLFQAKPDALNIVVPLSARRKAINTDRENLTAIRKEAESVRAKGPQISLRAALGAIAIAVGGPLVAVSMHIYYFFNPQNQPHQSADTFPHSNPSPPLTSGDFLKLGLLPFAFSFLPALIISAIVIYQHTSLITGAMIRKLTSLIRSAIPDLNTIEEPEGDATAPLSDKKILSSLIKLEKLTVKLEQMSPDPESQSDDEEDADENANENIHDSLKMQMVGQHAIKDDHIVNMPTEPKLTGNPVPTLEALMVTVEALRRQLNITNTPLSACMYPGLMLFSDEKAAAVINAEAVPPQQIVISQPQ